MLAEFRHLSLTERLVRATGEQLLRCAELVLDTPTLDDVLAPCR